MLYWRGQEWVGVGPGAHGRIVLAGQRIATAAQRAPADYIDAVNEHGVGWLEDAALAGEEIADEALIMGLRIEEGVDMGAIAQLRGKPLNAAAMLWLTQRGLVQIEAERLRLTRAGRLLANSIVAELVSWR